MPAARYWRLVAFDVENGSDLRLAEVELRAVGVRVDLPATLTSSFVPTSGTLAALENELTTDDVVFASGAVQSPGFEIAWDFGSDTLVDEFRLTLPGGAPSVNYCELQYLTVSGWQQEARWFGRFTNATPRVFDNGSDPSFDNVIFMLAQDPVDTTRLDVSKKRLPSSSSGGLPHTVVNHSSYGTWGSTWLTMTTSQTSTTQHSIPCVDTLTGDFTVDAWVFPWNMGSSNRTQIVSFGPTNQNWGLTMWMSGVGLWSFQVRNSAGTEVITSGNFSQLNWYFVQWVREAGVHKLYVSGTQRGSSHTDAADISISEFRLGNLNSASSGGISWNALRVTKGVVRPTTVPTAAYPEPPAAPLRTATSQPTLISEYPVPAFSISSAEPITLDLDNYGPGSVVGTVKEYDTPANVPLRRRVRLYDEITRRMIRETWSDPVTGAFAFTNLDPARRYTAMAYDHEGIYRALVIDRVEAV
jgi:hypothetical protein